MRDNSYTRIQLGQAILSNIPPLVISEFVEHSGFCQEHGLEVVVNISTDEVPAMFQRSELFEGVRQALACRGEVVIADNAGEEWKLIAEGAEDSQGTISIAYDKRKYDLSLFTVLSPIANIRTLSFERDALEFNLPTKVSQAWLDILSERPLEDHEFGLLQNILRETPVNFARSLRKQAYEGEIRLRSLIPTSRIYYERLIGAYKSCTSIKDYSLGSGRSHLASLEHWGAYDGFLYSLFLSAHSFLSTQIGIEELSKDELIQAYAFLEKSGDRISQIGAVEVGLLNLPKVPELEPYIVRMIEQIRDDDVKAPRSGFRLLSSLFILVEEELAVSRVLSDTPPFYRRLASLAHASLIQRETIGSHFDMDPFSNDIEQRHGEMFCFQTLADMRLEPHWWPDFAEAILLKKEFLDRLLNAAHSCEKNITSSKLRSILLGTGPESIFSQMSRPLLCYPGPLEGNVASSNELPDSWAETIETQIGSSKVTPASFGALVNSAAFFHLDSNRAEQAAEALKRSNYQLEDIEDRSQLVETLIGLARVAAVSRGEALADGLRILVHNYRRDATYAPSISEALCICIIASASRADLEQWRNCVGDWLGELAFEDFSKEDGDMFYSNLLCLLHAVPELWISCGKAEAAIRGVIEQ